MCHHVKLRGYEEGLRGKHVGCEVTSLRGRPARVRLGAMATDRGAAVKEPARAPSAHREPRDEVKDGPGCEGPRAGGRSRRSTRRAWKAVWIVMAVVLLAMAIAGVAAWLDKDQYIKRLFATGDTRRKVHAELMRVRCGVS